MRDAIERLAQEWRKRGHAIGFGVGIAQGYATLGRIGFEGRHEYSAIGTVIAGQDPPRFLDGEGNQIRLSRLSYSHF